MIKNSYFFAISLNEHFNICSCLCLSDGLIEILEKRRGGHGLYMGCMKSGGVISEEYILQLLNNIIDDICKLFIYCKNYAPLQF